MKKFKASFVFLIVLFLPFNSYGNAFDDQNTSICLNLIIENDAEVLERCLNTDLENIIDCVSVCDLGSTDDSVAIIQKFLKKFGIPGKFYRHRWSHLNFNRTLSIEAAQQTIKELGFSLQKSYILSLDPDMVLTTNGSFDKNNLKADAYLVAEQSLTFCSYIYKIHLMRASLKWKSTGITSEYGTDKAFNQCLKLPSLMIEEKGGGGFNDHKFGLQQITEALQNEPANPTFLFYHAQANKCQKFYEEAIKEFKSRIEKGGDKEEVWFSKYMIGKCYEEMGQFDIAPYWYLDAYQFHPQRAESLLKLANFYRHRDNPQNSHIFAKHGMSLMHTSLPDDQKLYDLPPNLSHQLLENLSIVSYYTGFKEEGFIAANHLVLKKNTPWWTKNQAYRNMLFYTRNLPQAEFKPIEIDLPLIPGTDEKYNPMNPSIIRTGEGYLMICRTVNYAKTTPQRFYSRHSSGIFHTRNYLIQYDREFNILSQKEIIEKEPHYRMFESYCKGLDDCRLFEWKSQLWFSCTTMDTNPNGRCQICLGKLSDDLKAENVLVETLTPLLGPDPNRFEKNWLPLIKDNEIHLIYSCDPFLMLKPDAKTGQCTQGMKYETEHDFSSFRGTASPIPFDEGYLMLVHEIALFENHLRCYLHRFVYLDKDYKIQKLSKPFTFLHQGIEFSGGMAIDHSGKRLIIPIGIEDEEAKLCFVNLQVVRSLLEPLPPGY